MRIKAFLSESVEAAVAADIQKAARWKKVQATPSTQKTYELSGMRHPPQTVKAMTMRAKRLMIAICAIVGRAAAFVVYLAALGHGSDDQPLELIDWIIAGVLLAPSFGLLIQWRRGRR